MRPDFSELVLNLSRLEIRQWPQFSRSEFCILQITPVGSKMANAQESFVSDSIDAAVEAINDLRKCEGNHVVLKREQLLAVKTLLNGKDVLAVLPKGFGKKA